MVGDVFNKVKDTQKVFNEYFFANDTITHTNMETEKERALRHKQKL